VAVPPDRDDEPVREFRSLTGELKRLADWLAECGIDTVAMESTDRGQAYCEERYRQRVVANLSRRALQPGMQVVPIAAA
jgi:hypothetical protein